MVNSEILENAIEDATTRDNCNHNILHTKCREWPYSDRGLTKTCNSII